MKNALVVVIVALVALLAWREGFWQLAVIRGDLQGMMVPAQTEIEAVKRRIEALEARTVPNPPVDVDAVGRPYGANP